MKKLIPFQVPAVLLVWLLLPFEGTVSGHSGHDFEDGTFFAESPVLGVRIIRKEEYDKRPAYYAASNLYTTLATARETGNRFAAFDFQVTPGGGPPPHTHSSEWEAFFVDEGEVSFTVGVTPDGTLINQEIPSGTLVYGPQGRIHHFLNESDKPARIFSLAMPAGLDVFFAESGERVQDFEAPIPPATEEEFVRTVFWAERLGIQLYMPGTPPVFPPGTPENVISSITGEGRGKFEGPFGEERLSLLTPQEAGNITGATAFCGPGSPGRPGGTVDYSYFSLPKQNDFPAPVTSANIEVFYTLGGRLSFKFEDEIVTVPALTYIEIQSGVPYSIRTESREPAESLAISVIAPECNVRRQLYRRDFP